MANDPTSGFNRTAITLSRNPLGIIALFIVLVYAFAAITISIPNRIDGWDRTIIVGFLALFPPIVLLAFVHLVTRYPRNLYGPGDFEDPSDWVSMMQAATTLAATSAAQRPSEGEVQASPAVIATQSLTAVRKASARSWSKNSARSKHVLWVDDHPENNAAVQRTFKTFNIDVTNALSTEQALQALKATPFDAIISDMGRVGDPEAGHTLLKAVRSTGNRVPFFIYSTRATAARLAETKELGGNGNTNSPSELFDQLTDVLGN